MNWYIGQSIIAIKNHIAGKFKKNDEFIIKKLKNSQCKCEITLIDIGIDALNSKTAFCTECNTFFPIENIHWFSEKWFAPLDVNISELTNILSEPLTINQ